MHMAAARGGQVGSGKYTAICVILQEQNTNIGFRRLPEAVPSPRSFRHSVAAREG
jgi:hypothetical protein